LLALFRIRTTVVRDLVGPACLITAAATVFLWAGMGAEIDIGRFVDPRTLTP
jgi:hypothetical protein